MFKSIYLLAITVTVMTTSLLCISPKKAHAEWILDTKLSHLTYASTKRTQTGNTGEVNHFQKISGKVSDDGTAEITINMNSVETNAKSRNKRVKEHVFKTSEFPIATVTTKLDMDEFKDMEIGEIKRVEILAKLTLVGIEEDIYIVLDVSRLEEKRVSVINQGMVIINADNYEMSEGLDKLVTIAKIRSINPLFPVSFHLIFNQK